jgi:hypothetical protein
MDRSEIVARLHQFEISMLQPEVRASRDRLNELIADDFIEFGRSGRTYDKITLLAALAQESGADPAPTVTDFQARFEADTVVLITYRSTRASGSPPTVTNRSSLWRLRDERWQMTFHQGTPALQ